MLKIGIFQYLLVTTEDTELQLMVLKVIMLYLKLKPKDRI